MKALKSHPHIERPRRINSQITLTKYTAGLVLALAGLISATLMKGPIQLVSAETVALGWSNTGSLNTPRRSHTSTLLPDGKILVAGGLTSDASQCLDGAELYDPATGKWNATGRLNVPRSVHTATLLKDGKVLIVGGSADANHSFNGAELYDPKNERWSVTGSLATPRCVHTATLLKNGKVLVVGGLEEFNSWDYGYRPLDTVELYDPDTGVWSFTGNLNTAVGSHTATLLQNGKVLVLGEGSAELYDPDTGEWSSTGPLIHYRARIEHTATLLPDGKVLVAGGSGVVDEVSYSFPLRSSELYDPDTETWSFAGDFNTPRGSHTATILPDGKVLVAGGTALVERRSNTDSGIVSLRSSELFDPDKGTWSFAGSLKTRRSGHTATLLPDGIPMLVGGISQDPTRWSVDALDSVELGNTFVTLPKITMASVAGRKLIVAGENFGPDAVILINGEEQKTRNDDQNPGTTLIGKKAGKKIKPGDRLQVRNPDGPLSEEFIFIGSQDMSIIQSEKEIQNATTKISHRLDSAGHERQDCSTARTLSPRIHPSFACSVAQRTPGYVGRAA